MMNEARCLAELLQRRRQGSGDAGVVKRERTCKLPDKQREREEKGPMAAEGRKPVAGCIRENHMAMVRSHVTTPPVLVLRFKPPAEEFSGGHEHRMEDFLIFPGLHAPQACC
mmetsp:Transcript_7668/g.17556  ORF Transcript_7668/g.17556 Transcript_7668/m.17556 type:complete len:112 (-) Transcript_7668:31-366(-)